MYKQNNTSNNCIGKVAESEEIDGDNMMENHLNIIISFLFSKDMLDELAQVVTHTACEVVRVVGWVLEVRKVCKNVYKLTFSSQHWRQNERVFEHVPTSKSRNAVVDELEQVLSCLLWSFIPHL